jgi:hypothetical protein
VAIAAPRNALLDRLLPLPGFWRVLLWNLPQAVRPKPTLIAWVMAFDLDGRLVHDLRTSDGSYGFVTSVAEHDGVGGHRSEHTRLGPQHGDIGQAVPAQSCCERDIEEDLARVVHRPRLAPRRQGRRYRAVQTGLADRLDQQHRPGL